MFESVMCWIVLGGIGGYAAGKLANPRGERTTMDLVLGVSGSVFGGWLSMAFAGKGMMAGFDPRSLAVAFAGLLTFLVIGRTLRSQRSNA